METLTDTLTRDDLQALVTRQESPWVSIYFSTHKTGREVQQDPVRLRNLLDAAEEQLVRAGIRSPDAAAILSPGRELAQDARFWERRARGVALFLYPGGSAAYRLPLDFEELAIVAPRPHLKPLFQLFAGDGRFHLLALAQKGLRLFRGSRFELEQIELDTLPKSLQDALQPDTQKPQLQLQTRPPGRPGEKPAIFHGQSVGTYDEKNPVARYFKEVDRAMHEYLRDENAPLVLAGVEYLLPLYRNANTYPHLLEEGITGNPEGLQPHELHDPAWKIVEPHFSRAEAEARSRYEQLAGQANAGEAQVLAMNRVDDVVPAASAGRVDSLFVAVNAHCWGRFNDQRYAVDVHDEPQPGDEDLLDHAAVDTFLKGGTVYAVPPERVPGGSPIAAVLRF